MTGEIGFDLNSGKAVSIERGGKLQQLHSDGTFRPKEQSSTAITSSPRITSTKAIRIASTSLMLI